MARTYLTEAPVTGPLHLFIATAAYQFHPNYTHSLAAAMPVLERAGIPVDLCHVADHCHVDDARNAMVRQFLMSQASHLVFIDNDVGFAAENLLRLAQINPDVDMVAGVYPLKEDSEGYPVRLPDGVELWANEDGLVEVEGLPTGFLRISRRCLEQMIKAYGDRKFYGRGQSHDDLPHVILFERTYENGVRYSGDYAFCEKWRALGGKMYVDPEMHFTHSGTHEWEGTLGDYWRKTFGVTERRFESAIERMKQGRFDGETAQWLIDGWGNAFAAHPNTLIACWYAAKKAKQILETGSGLTTLVMALANPDATITAIESEVEYLLWLKDRLHGHCKNVLLYYSRLQDGWYSSVESNAYDLVFLDGPNRQKGDRNKAFDRIGDVLAGATVIMDDANDPALLAGLSAWCEKTGREYTLIGVKDQHTAISTRQEST